MKRRIDVSQLDELIEEQKQKLREWWEPECGDYYLRVTVDGVIDSTPFLFNLGDFRYNNYKEFKLPLLSIAQMIELIESSKPTLRINKNLPSGLEISTTYEVFQQGAGTHWGETLCDALWEAVKSVL